MGRTFFIGLCISITFSSLSFAGLGQDEKSCDDEALFFKARGHDVATYDKYKIHTLTLNDGMIIKEYVAKNGTVFGIAWSGARYHPHFDKLLGVHFNEYKAHSHEMPKLKGHRFNTLNTKNITVTMGGHMGSCSGSAFAPHLLPSGFSMEEIR